MLKQILKKLIKSLLWMIDKDHRSIENISTDNMKKFTHIEEVDLQSDFGKFSKVFRTVPYQAWKLRTETKTLVAADRHRIIREDGSCAWLEDLSPSDLIKTDVGIEKVISCRNLGVRTHMYCLQIDTDEHLFYTDGILSHNTTCAAGFLLWKAMFTPDMTILIVANKYVQALEIMDRIRYIYDNCPDHIRAGTIDYNKGNITFDNGSRIISRASSSDAGRGLAISLLYADEFAFVRPNIQRDFWAAIKPVLSCVAGDTLVLTDNGYQKIESLHKDKEVGNYFEFENLETFGKCGMEKVSHGYVSPESETLIIETKRGFSLEVTPNHPLYLLNNNLVPSMTKAKDITEGFLRISCGMNIYGNDVSLKDTCVAELSDELGYMVGGWIAEGWITKHHTVELSNTDDEFRDKYLSNTMIKPFVTKPSNAARVICYSTEMVKLFKEVGVNPLWKCHTKEVPHRILTAPKSIQAAFLSGLFDGDGSVSKDRIILSSTSKKLLKQVQLMLVNMGILSIVALTQTAERALEKQIILPHGNVIKSARDAYSLSISRSQFVKFQNQIGFSISRKALILKNVVDTKIQNDDKIGVEKTSELVDFINRLVKGSRKSNKWFRQNGIRLEKCSVMHSPKGIITNLFLKNFRSLLKEINSLTDLDEEIFDELLGNFVWDRIKSITPSTNKTYDFTVPETHSFLQNGILGSNTGGSCIVTSTPRNDEDIFAQIWKSAVDTTDQYGNTTEDGLGKNGWFAIECPWYEHPERDEAWAEKERIDMGENRFLQEHSCQFYSDEETLINSMCLKRLTDRTKEPEFYVGTTRWYAEPRANKGYLVALDPAVGTGGDFAAIQVFQMPEMIQIAEWSHNHTQAKGQVLELMRILLWLDQELRDQDSQMGEPDIYWTFENNGIGMQIHQIIQDTGEERFPGVLVSDRKTPGAKGGVRGLYTGRNKINECARLKSLLESDRMQLSSKNLVRELKYFIAADGGKTFRGKTGEHDDLVASTLLIIRLLEYVMKWEDRNTAALREHIEDYEIAEIDPLPVVV